MSKKILILGASILQLPAIKEALDMGLETIVVDKNPNAIGFAEENVTREVVSTIDIPAVLEVAERHRVDGVMTLATDLPVRSASAVAKALGLPGISEECAVKATDKAEMRKALGDAGVPIPTFFRAASEEEFWAAVAKLTPPFMIKPADSSGSRGIFKIEPGQDDKAALASAYAYSKNASHNGVVVVEEFMEGPEVSVETLTVDGVCHVVQITDKQTNGAPHFVETGHSQPSTLPEDIKEQIREVTIAANRAIGITLGPSHTEIIVTKDGPKIVELGARLGGDCITTHLVPLSTGVNMVRACIQIALGERPDIEPAKNCGSAIRYFPQKAGVIQSITGLEEAEKMPGVKQISIVHNLGEAVTDITDSSSRMGFVIADGENADAAVANCEAALKSIKIEIQSDPNPAVRRKRVPPMKLLPWNRLPEKMQCPEVRPYYEILSKKKFSLFVKRAFDIFASLLLLTLSSPIFLILAIAIKLDSPGPVFYRQVRVTQYGREFRIHKFRSMRTNADREGTLVTLHEDRRITRTGKYIRKFHFDEISQLIDVLAGDMTFVGVRPEVPKYVACYTPEMMATLLLPAGITSLASIRYRNEASLLSKAENANEVYVRDILPKKMAYNLEGIRNFCPLTDLKICFMTVFAVFKRGNDKETANDKKLENNTRNDQ